MIVSFVPSPRLLALVCLVVALILPNSAAGQEPYRNPDLYVEERIRDLLDRMTLEEKFWQLFMIPGDLENEPDRYRHGLFGFQVDTTPRRHEEAGQLLEYGSSGTARQAAEKINEIQRYFVERTRLGIPIIPFDEGLHGLVREGATAFPQAIGLAATWDGTDARHVPNRDRG